ncbi:hypothetical protein D3C76_1566580 [compost metagenome]
MRTFTFEVEYMGGYTFIYECQATNLAAAWFQVALNKGEYARNISFIRSMEEHVQ